MALLLAHGGAITIVLVVSMPLWLKLIAVTALVINLGFEMWRNALMRDADAVVAIGIAADNALSIQTRRGDWVDCTVRGDTYVASFLVVLNLRRLDNERRKIVVILPDAIDAEDFRKLRVWLRWKDSPKTN